MAKLSSTNVFGDLYVDGKIVGEIDGAVSTTEYTDTSDVSINMDYSAQIGTLSNLKTTEKTNLVNAINELFQNANSGKQLIASAIGEPLDSNDTFNAMSNDINSLLNTFKTNMMINGVSVGSEDKFKSLIDKIATLANNENKGLRYAEGTYEDFTLYLTTSGSSVEIPYELDFTPTLIFVKFDRINNTSGTTITNATVSNKGNSQFYMNYGLLVSVYNISSNGFTIFTSYGGNSDITFKGVTWYAIGVGEESNSGGLDIISAASLPATGKENQICVITNSPTDKYMISSDVQDDDKTGIFCLTSTIPGSITYTSTSKNTTVKYYMLYFSQNNTIVPSYIYKNGNWAPLTNNRIYLLKDGVYVNEDIFGGLTKTTTHSTYTVNYAAGTGIYGNAYSSYYTHFISSVNRVNFTNFNKVVVRLKVKTDEYDYSGDYHAYVSAWSTPKCVRGANMSDGYNNNNSLTGALKPTNKSANREKFYFTGTWNYYELDISSWTNTDYLTILIGDTNYCPYWYISDIYIY